MLYWKPKAKHNSLCAPQKMWGRQIINRDFEQYEQLKKNWVWFIFKKIIRTQFIRFIKYIFLFLTNICIGRCWWIGDSRWILLSCKHHIEENFNGIVKVSNADHWNWRYWQELIYKIKIDILFFMNKKSNLSIGISSHPWISELWP